MEGGRERTWLCCGHSHKAENNECWFLTLSFFIFIQWRFKAHEIVPLSFRVGFSFFLKSLQDTSPANKKSTITPTQMCWADINTDHWQGLSSSWSVHPHCWLLCRAQPPYKPPHWPHAEWLYQASFRLLTLHSELRPLHQCTPCLNRKHQCHRLSSPIAILWEVLLSNNFLSDAIFITDGGS